MKFFFLAFTALCCFCTTYAQIAYTPGSNTFSLSPTVPVIGSNNPLLPNAVNNIPGSIGTTPSCAFVLEYGDGYFSSNISSSHTYKTAGSRMAVLSLSGRYDTIKPPRAFAAHINDLANYNGSPTQSILNTNEFVRLTPIANNINVRDEMLFILTYKIPQHTDGGKLMLFYNESNFNVFESIAGPSSVITESTDDANVSGSVKRIRTYFTESPAIAGLPMGTVSGLAGTGYADALTWNFSLAAPYTVGEERNIFITLRTKNNFTKQTTGHIEAVFVHNKTTDISSLMMSVSADPHDPNYIVTTPKCIQTGSGVTPVKYLVHFQNEGGGQAYRLNINLKTDARLADVISRLTYPDFKIEIGNRLLNDTDYDYHVNSNGSLSFDIPKRNRATFVRADSSLSCNLVPIWFSNRLTMGDIEFTLQVPNTAEADLRARAGITFFARRTTSSMTDQTPTAVDSVPVVYTSPDTLFVRTKCSEELFPCIRPLPNDTSAKDTIDIDHRGIIPPPCIDCKCKSFLSICWWWWIMIGVVLVAAVWFIARRNGKKKNNNNT